MVGLLFNGGKSQSSENQDTVKTRKSIYEQNRFWNIIKVQSDEWYIFDDFINNR